MNKEKIFDSHDIEDIKFREVRRGYPKEEVDNFLMEIKEKFEEYENEIKTLTEKINSLNKILDSEKTEKDKFKKIAKEKEKIIKKDEESLNDTTAISRMANIEDRIDKIDNEMNDKFNKIMLALGINQ